LVAVTRKLIEKMISNYQIFNLLNIFKNYLIKKYIEVC
jgi:hypothetical protein